MRYLSSKERTPWGLLAHQRPQLADEKWPKWGDDTFVQLFTLSRTRVTCPQPPGVKVEQGAVHYGTMCLKTKFLNGKRVDCIWLTTFPSYTSTSVTVSRTWVWQIFSLCRLYLTLQPLLDLPILNHDSCIWIEWLKIIFVFEGGRKIGHNFLQILIFICSLWKPYHVLHFKCNIRMNCSSHYVCLQVSRSGSLGGESFLNFIKIFNSSSSWWRSFQRGPRLSLQKKRMKVLRVCVLGGSLSLSTFDLFPERLQYCHVFWSLAPQQLYTYPSHWITPSNSDSITSYDRPYQIIPNQTKFWPNFTIMIKFCNLNKNS